MHIFSRNVNDSFRRLLEVMENPTHCGYSDPPVIRFRHSRAGHVKMIEEPVTVTYTRPRERVLFNRARNANPFFHLFESLWMLAGRNDVAPLAEYNSQIAKVASDNGVKFNGAYGERWWRYYTIEEGSQQLRVIIDQLRRKPDSRRCVLQMWNVEDDLLRIDQTKDVCCNVCAFFSIRCSYDRHLRKVRYLDMTVVNRSNDLVWGMLGANVVHFSILQEYLAACIGVEVGVYNQFTNNLHVYLDRYEPDKWLADRTEFDYSSCSLFPLVKNPGTFDQEVVEFIDNTDWTRRWSEPFLDRVASPMCWAYKLHKRREYDLSLATTDLILADDWRFACRNWIERRKQSWEAKHQDE